MESQNNHAFSALAVICEQSERPPKSAEKIESGAAIAPRSTGRFTYSPGLDAFKINITNLQDRV